MSSQRQIDANRLNAQKSTGPTTPEGRAAVRLNSLKYGLYAETLILPGEDPAAFEALLDRLDAEHQPATPTEEAFVSQIAMATWRRARIQRMEAAFYKSEHKACIGHDKWYGELDDTGRLALIAERDAGAKRLLDSFSRQEARLDRAIKSAVQELRRCRTDRRAPENSATDNKDPVPIGFALQVDVEHPKNPSTAKIISIETPIPIPPDGETPPPTDK
jgi:hypothetical protein